MAVGSFFLCIPDCPKKPKTSFPYYKLFFTTISAKISVKYIPIDDVRLRNFLKMSHEIKSANCNLDKKVYRRKKTYYKWFQLSNSRTFLMELGLT